MSSNNMASWRRQNSDAVLVEVHLVDGTMLRGTVLVQKERTLKELFCGSEPFVEFECSVSGDMVLGKTAVASVRPFKAVQTDQLDRKQKLLEKSDAYSVLKVPRTASRDQVRDAYLRLARTYHPDRYSNAALPPEVFEYLNAVTRRINTAYSELNLLMEGEVQPSPAAA